jgi:hypothetical protein
MGAGTRKTRGTPGQVLETSQGRLVCHLRMTPRQIQGPGRVGLKEVGILANLAPETGILLVAAFRLGQ